MKKILQNHSGSENNFFQALTQKFSQLPQRARLSSAALVASNLVPLAGTLFFSWSSAGLLLTYWAESAVIGGYTVLKILKARGKDAPGEESTMTVLGETYPNLTVLKETYPNLLPSLLVPFFALHFGLFMLAHLAFIAGLVLRELSFSQLLADAPFYAAAVAGMIASHGISFKLNFIDGRECEKISREKAMFSPYPRIIAMHFAILFGGFIGASAIILAVMKTFFDLSAHLSERTSFPTAVSIESAKKYYLQNKNKKIA